MSEDDLTLRDYFAAAALEGFCANMAVGNSSGSFELMARMAYDAAEEMLQERDKRGAK